jgi:hypothetical protein
VAYMRICKNLASVQISNGISAIIFIAFEYICWKGNLQENNTNAKNYRLTHNIT